MGMRVVTTFPPDAPYAQDFLESYTKHWDTEIYVYYEDRKPDFKHPLVKYFSLNADKERAAFIKRNEGRKVPQSDPGNAYRWDWKRFCHKVFALTNPRNTKDTDWLIWLDADVMTLDTVDNAFLEQVCKGDVSYVGRDQFTHPDCAFVAYKKPDFLGFLRNVYSSDELFELEEWHDSYVFAVLARDENGMFGARKIRDEDTKGILKASIDYDYVSLSPGIPGMQVFDDCILGTKMRHLKGPLRKQGLPVPNGQYASQMEQTVSGRPVPVSGMRPIEIKTKNCVPDDRIRANIHYNVTLLDKWIIPCQASFDRIVFCSGGPSLENYFEDIKRHQKEGAILACVKHAHDRMIEAGIIPDFCVLLDPRGHVLDFIENPHPDVLYIISSMVHPTTTDQLLEKNARVIGYHAHVGAEEDKVLVSRQQSGVLIGGGCSAAMRGISVLHTMGYSRFTLYGYDLCYDKKPFKGKKSPKKADGTPEYIEVSVFGKKFWSDPEKVAQAQDFEKLIKEPGNRVEIEAHGPGMIPHMWAATHKPLPRLEDLIGTKPSPS